jgi:hypothetical protein
MYKRDKAYQLAIKILKQAIDKEISHSRASIINGKGKNFVSALKTLIDKEHANHRLSQRVYDEFLDVFDEYERSGARGGALRGKLHDKEVDLSNDEKFEALSKAGPIRGEKTIIDSHTGYEIKQIKEYFYDIKVSNYNNVKGFFTRSEMETVYKLYSNLDGAGLTQRAVARYFPTITFRDFKRILKAFNITKSSAPIAPHQLEELEIDKVAELIFKNKENLALERLESERNKQTEQVLRKTRKELIDLKREFSNIQKLTANINFDNIKPFTIEPIDIDEELGLIIYLSDMHIGAFNNNRKTLYNDNNYNKDTVLERLQQIIEEIQNKVNTYGVFDKIIVINLGDALDGYDGKTTRGGHILPQNMDNETQFMVFIEAITSFIETLHIKNFGNSIEYYSVNGGNHDGSFGWVANKSLELYFSARYPEMKVRIFDKFIDVMEYGQHTFILTHGKDDSDKKFGFPMYMNDKTENYFNQFLDNNGIYKDNIHIISGDLHQSTSFWGKRFRYKKVASLFGSSKWIQHNFGNTKAATNYDIVYKNKPTVLEGIVWHNKQNKI